MCKCHFNGGLMDKMKGWIRDLPFIGAGTYVCEMLEHSPVQEIRHISHVYVPVSMCGKSPIRLFILFISPPSTWQLHTYHHCPPLHIQPSLVRTYRLIGGPFMVTPEHAITVKPISYFTGIGHDNKTSHPFIPMVLDNKVHSLPKSQAFVLHNRCNLTRQRVVQCHE